MAKRSGRDHTIVLFDLLSQLPNELKSDILSRLPIELLLKLRCFSKEFRDLIDGPYLRNLSTDRIIPASSHSVTTPVSFLTLVQFNEEYDCKFHFADYNNDAANNDYYKITRPIRYPHLNSWNKGLGNMIVGSCNGLVCHAEHTSIKFGAIYIFNPVTREQLSLAPLGSVTGLYSEAVVKGFGYHPVTKEYKVVRIYYSGEKDAVGEIEVYTLGTGEWRSIGKVRSDFNAFYDSPSVLVNGALHWYDSDGRIASFDLAAETFDLVPSLSSVTLIPDGCSWYSLCALEERLCVVDHFQDTMLYIWVLNEDQSWTMDFSVEIEIDPPLCSHDMSLDVDTSTPITLTKTGKLLLWYNYKMFASYDRNNEKQILYGEYKAGHFNEIVPHVKSFVSLKDLGEHSEILKGKYLCFLTLIQIDEEKHGRFYLAEYDDVTNEYMVTQPVTHPLLNLRNKEADNIIVGSCNGLVCYADHRRFKFDPICVFNPVTSELLNLSPLGSVKKLYSSVVSGFGYHPATKVYKVVRIYYEVKKDAGGEVEVYTLGTGVWRRVGKVPPQFNAFLDFPGVLVSGALHWFDHKGSIASFDLATEIFVEVPSPSSLTFVPHGNSQENRYNLCALREHLCVIHHFKESRIYIWELNKDQSWGIKFRFSVKVDPPLCANDKSLKHDCCTPITFTDSGKLLLWYNCKIFASYDPENQETITHGVYKAGHFNEIVVHVKSSVSLKALGEKNAKVEWWSLPKGRKVVSVGRSSTLDQCSLNCKTYFHQTNNLNVILMVTEFLQQEGGEEVYVELYVVQHRIDNGQGTAMFRWISSTFLVVMVGSGGRGVINIESSFTYLGAYSILIITIYGKLRSTFWMWFYWRALVAKIERPMNVVVWKLLVTKIGLSIKYSSGSLQQQQPQQQ